MERLKLGLLLPHFGHHASPEGVVEMVPRIEELGFASVWVRDHLVFRPHAMEAPDRTHVEPTVVLSAVAAKSKSLELGTASLIPYRHPIHCALTLASLDWLSGGRVIAGFGLGTFNHEFESIGLGAADRRELLREQIDIMRRLWSGSEIDHSGKYYDFSAVDIHPEPLGHKIPIWYCGTSPAAARRTVEWDLQGWMPGRINYATFASRVDRIRQFTERRETDAGTQPVMAAIPITSPGSSKEEGLKRVNVDEILGQARNGGWVSNRGEGFSSVDDIAGAVLAGRAEDIAEGVEKYRELGLSHLVFDLRLRFDEWEELVEFLGSEVLPLLQGAQT